jgi:tetratricopeptide (TPR) repeat protein
MALALMALPRPAAAQDDCVGEKPRGGRAVTSAELYVDQSRGKTPADRRRLLEQGIAALEVDIDENADRPNPQVYLWAGRIYADLDRFAEADAAWTMALDLWSCYEARIDTLRFNAYVRAFNRAVGYQGAGDVERAREGYQNAWTVYKKDPNPMLQLGSMYAHDATQATDPAERDELQEQAIEYFQAAIVAGSASERLNEQQRDENMRSASFNLAQLLAMDERFEEAAAAYDEFLEYEPGNVDAMSNAAVVLTRASRKYRSDAVSMEAGPDREALLTKADSVQRVALNYYSELLAREDLDAADYHNIGVGLTQIGLHEEAVRAFTAALDLEPYRANSLEQLGLSLFNSAQFDSLVVVGRALVERYPLNMNNLAMLANAYRETEQVDSALAVLQRREDAELDFVQVRVESEEGTYSISGSLVNFKLDVGANVQIQFDFYDDLGEIIQSETISLPAPEQGNLSPVRHSFESDALISGFTYARVGT